MKRHIKGESRDAYLAFINSRDIEKLYPVTCVIGELHVTHMIAVLRQVIRYNIASR